MRAVPNQAAAGKAAIARRLAIEHHWPGLPEPGLGYFESMHYIVHSKFHDDIAALKPRCERWIVSRWVFRLLAPVLAWVAYFGLVGATMAFFLMPFQVLRLCSIGPPSAAYWIGASLTIALIIFALVRSLRRIVGGLRLRIVELDAIASFAGIGLAAALAAYLYPIGWPRDQRKTSPNHSIQRIGASRSPRAVIGAQWWLAPAADAAR